MQDYNSGQNGHKRCDKTLTALIIALAIGFIWYILLILATIRFIRIYKLQYKLIVMFFLMLNIAMISRITFYFDLYFDLHNHKWNVTHEWSFFITKDLTNFGVVQAVIFSLFYWLSLICTINQEIGDRTKFWNSRTMNTLMTISTIFNILVFTFSMTTRWKYQVDTDKKYMFIVSRILKSIIYCMFAILYIIAGVLLYK